MSQAQAQNLNKIYVYESRLELERKVEEVWARVNKVLRDRLTKTEIVRIMQRELNLFTFDFAGVAKFTEYTDLKRDWSIAGIALVNVGGTVTPHLILFRFRDEEGLEYVKMVDMKIIGSIHISERR